MDTDNKPTQTIEWIKVPFISSPDEIFLAIKWALKSVVGVSLLNIELYNVAHFFTIADLTYGNWRESKR